MMKLPPDVSFGEIAHKYSRPPYPDDLIDAVVKQTHLTANSVIADIGAGNGLLGLAFARRGHRTILVDANQKMLNQAQPGELKDLVETRIGRAEETGLGNATVDLVMAGNAAHWFSPKAEQTRREFRRILKPGGKVAFFFMVPSLHDPFIAALHQHMLDQIAAYHERPAFVFHEADKIADHALLLIPDAIVLDKRFHLPLSSRDIIGYLDTTHTFSQIFSQNPESRQNLLTFADTANTTSTEYECSVYIGNP